MYNVMTGAIFEDENRLNTFNPDNLLNLPSVVSTFHVGPTLWAKPVGKTSTRPKPHLPPPSYTCFNLSITLRLSLAPLFLPSTSTHLCRCKVLPRLVLAVVARQQLVVVQRQLYILQHHRCVRQLADL